uniref:DUF4283 domain-containing protein n=1 Tax=Zea mays TaxID=4577 RepID=A0A804M0Q9_MAIZE
MEKGDDIRGSGRAEPPRGSSQGNAMGRGRFAPPRGGFHPGRGGFGARGGFGNRFQGNSKTWNRFGGGHGGSGSGQGPCGDAVPLGAGSRRGEEMVQGQARLGLVAGSMAAELQVPGPNKGDAIEVGLLQQVVSSLQEAKKDGRADVSLPELLRALLEKVEDKGKSWITSETSSLVEPDLGDGASQISGGAGAGAEVPEGSIKGGSRKNAAKAYCHRCRSKGHYLADCKEEFLCEVCDSVDHPKSRCLVFNHLKQRPGCIYLSGFAAVGLGFFHIPVTVRNPAKREGLDAVIRVTEGELTEVEVAAELKRLIPGTQDWKVQMVQSNVFRTAFPSTTELQRLVEWGTVHSKKKGVLFHFEEKQSEKPCKVVNSYWVQVMGIPLAYRTFPTIWAVGSLLGTSIDVDMKHTRQFEVGRVQVMILDANLIPSTVEVVIGEEVYLLSFRVEDGNGGLLPETDNVERGFNDDDDDLLGDDDGDDLNGVGPGQLGKMGDRAPAAGTGGSFTHQSKTGTAQGAALDEEGGMGLVAGSGGQQVAQDGAVEPYQSVSCSAQELAAIPEMLAGSKSTRSSKRRGASMDESTLERAERLKARLNEVMWDLSGIKGGFGTVSRKR